MTLWFATLGTAVVMTIILFGAVPSACAQTDETANETPSMSPAAAKQIIEARSRSVIAAIQAKNMTSLARFAHPTKGVRFSPYSSVAAEDDLVFKPAQLRGLARSQRRYHWGEFDGTGDPIRMTFNRYYRRFVYDRNFAAAPEIGYNELSSAGTVIMNLFSSYPGAIIVDYHFPETDTVPWNSLRLVFQKHGEVWYLVGVVHNEWTI
jgi:hypothetical protein